MSASPAKFKKHVQQLPKVDLHRHLEGSLRFETILELTRQAGLGVPEDLTRLRRLAQVQPNEHLDYRVFLDKFEYLRHLFRSAEIIQRVTREAVQDAAGDCVRYLELQFTPVALAQAASFDLGEVFDWVLETASSAAQDAGIGIGLIASINRNETLAQAEEVGRHAVQRLGRGIVGLSLAGDEVNFPSEPFIPVLNAARQAGLGLSIHAGEWAGAANVRFAIEHLGARRIGHGVRILEDPHLVAMARELGVVFEICLSSNLHSGVVGTLEAHPLLEMIQAGLRVTLNTDDPGISDTCLSDEYLLALNTFELSLESLKGMILTAVQSVFLAKRKKTELENEFVALLFRSDAKDHG